MSKREPYNYHFNAVLAVDYLNHGAEHEPLKRILRKLVRETIIARDRQLGVTGNPYKRDATAKEIIP